MGQHAEIIDDTDGNQYPQTGEKFTLLQNISLTGFPDGGRDIEHCLMGRQLLCLGVLHPSESDTDGADGETEIQDENPVQRPAHETDGRQIGQFDVRFTGKSHRDHQKQHDSHDC